MSQSTHEPTLYPYLRYNDARAAIDFLEAAFGFEAVQVHEDGDGNIGHAELAAGGDLLMLGRAGGGDERSPEDLDAVGGGLYVYVEDVDAHCDRAREAGATITEPPRDKPYGGREYSAEDPEGHHWSFGSYRPTVERD